MAGQTKKLKMKRTRGDRIFQPFHDFAALQTSGGILLILVTIVALVWANSPWSESYHHLWHADFHLGFDHFLGIDHANLNMHLSHCHFRRPISRSMAGGRLSS